MHCGRPPRAERSATTDGAPARSTTTRGAATAPLNRLLVTLDTFRADRIGPRLTPALERLATTCSTPKTRASRLVQNQLSTAFMQPNAFAGDFQQSEQRLAQVGFRFSF
jgi:hypothetical protein